MEPLFVAWESFFIIVGSSAAALTGLQFVVMALANDNEVGSPELTRAFGTPTVVHFTAALIISSLFSAPWHVATWPLLLTAGCGVAGTGYVIFVIYKMQQQVGYRLVLEDVVFHGLLPLVAYVLLVAAGTVWQPLHDAMFGIGASTIVLMLIGIHNAWDAALFIANRQRGGGA